MNKKNISVIGLAAGIFILAACGGGSTSTESASGTQKTSSTAAGETDSYDPNRGEGKYDASNLQAGPLDAAMAGKGKDISATKCNSCHKMTDEKLVGPGWKGVTERRSLHWLMNFITNPDPMIDKDPELQAQLELCLVRMPNQNLNDEEARSVVEYMRQNDGAKSL